MSLGKYIEQNFPIECNGQRVVKIFQRHGNETNISSIVDCPYNYGAHGERCKFYKAGTRNCPYSFDIPHALESQKEVEDEENRY